MVDEKTGIESCLVCELSLGTEYVTISAMTAQEYLNSYQGQSLLFAPSPAREYLRGQCVQAVCFYVSANGRPVIWADAYNWWTNRNPAYDYIDNSPSAVPQPGDIIIWGPATPGSGGAGHIAVCLQGRPGTGTFISVDQNWGGKTVHTVMHNYNNVVGWLRFKGAAAPAAQPQGDEMIADVNQAHQAYRLLRPNGDGSDGEINATAGRRSWASFANDAQGEVNARNQNLRDQGQHLNDLSGQINVQNQTIVDLTAKLNDANLSNTEKQKALDGALTDLGHSNAELTTLHDQLKDLQIALPTADPATPPASDSPSTLDSTGWVTKLLAAILRRVGKS